MEEAPSLFSLSLSPLPFPLPNRRLIHFLCSLLPPGLINRQVSPLFTPKPPRVPIHPSHPPSGDLPAFSFFFLLLLLTPSDRQTGHQAPPSPPPPLPRGHGGVRACRQRGGTEGHLPDALTSHLALTDSSGGVTGGAGRPPPPRPPPPCMQMPPGEVSVRTGCARARPLHNALGLRWERCRRPAFPGLCFCRIDELQTIQTSCSDADEKPN